MLRIDPARPPLWQSESSVQFGIPAVAVVEVTAPWQLHLIRELERGVPEDALTDVAAHLGAPREAARRFIARLQPALEAPRAPRRAMLQVPVGTPSRQSDLILRTLRTARMHADLSVWPDPVSAPLPAGIPVILLAQHLVEPRRTAALMVNDVPHLPLVFCGSHVEVGPYVDPGRTACLACAAAHRRDADPSWPIVAAQLVGREPFEITEVDMLEGALAAARLLSDAQQRDPLKPTRSLVLRDGSLRPRVRVHRPHAACLCRSPEESGTASAPVHLEPRTRRVFARPA